MATVDVFSAVYQVGELALREIQRRSEDRRLVREWFGKEHASVFCDNVNSSARRSKLKRIMAVAEHQAVEAANHILNRLPFGQEPSPERCCWVQLYTCWPRDQRNSVVVVAEHRLQNVGYLHAKPTADIPIWTALALIFGDHGRVSIQTAIDSGAARISAACNRMIIVMDRVNLNAKWSGHIQYRQRAINPNLVPRDGWRNLLRDGHTALDEPLREAVDRRGRWEDEMGDPRNDPRIDGSWWSNKYNPAHHGEVSMMAPDIAERLHIFAVACASVIRDAAETLRDQACSNPRLAVEWELSKPLPSRRSLSPNDTHMLQLPYDGAQYLRLEAQDLQSDFKKLTSNTHKLLITDFSECANRRLHANMTNDDVRACMSSALDMVHLYFYLSRYSNMIVLREFERVATSISKFCYIMELLTADSPPPGIRRDAGIMVAFGAIA